MHHELVIYALRLVDGSPDPNEVKIAMLTLAGGVVATVGTVLVAFRSPGESRHAGRGDERYQQALKRERDEAQREARAAQVAAEEVQAKLAVYERFMWLHHIDPRKIQTGDETADDVRF